MTPQRLITQRQEQIYRMRHQDFGGLATKQVAAMLGVGEQWINRQMKKMKKIAPQLFPILTKRQADIYNLHENVGLLVQEIAEYLGVCEGTIGNILIRLKKKDIYIYPRRSHKPIEYSLWMDSKITRKF